MHRSIETIGLRCTIDREDVRCHAPSSREETDGVDPDWSIWYAGHLLEKGFDTLLDAKLLKSDVIYLLVLVDKQQMSEAPGAHWERYYADFFVRRYLK
jgi:hypothetical protein